MGTRQLLALLFASCALLCSCRDGSGRRVGATTGAAGGSPSASARELREGATREGLGAASRFGVDYVFPLQAKYRKEIWPKVLSTTGAGWLNFADVAWRRIEPRPPSKRGHSYEWEELDKAVKLYQAQGFRLVFSLRIGKGWFAGPIRHRPAIQRPMVSLMVRHSDRLPADEHRASYRAWIGALVERYDGDGKADMPGLETPVLHYQVGNEYANPMFWTGTLDDYETLLDETARAARAAHRDVQVISNGIRWNDLFHADRDGTLFEQRFDAFLARLASDDYRAEWKRARKFTEGTVALAAHYDILDAGGNGPYPTASAGYFAWVQSELGKTGASPAIWDMEARSEPMIVADPATTFHMELKIPGGDEIKTRLHTTLHRDHDRVQAWYRAEQARILTKVFVTRFAAGFEKVFLGMPDDWDRSVATLATPNPFIGLCDREGNPWPALRAFAVMVDAVDGFAHAEQLQASANVELYRFRFEPPRRDVFVAWLREDKPYGLNDTLPRRRVTLDSVPTPAVLRAIPTFDQPPAEVRFAATQKVAVELTPTPVIIQPGKETSASAPP